MTRVWVGDLVEWVVGGRVLMEMGGLLGLIRDWGGNEGEHCRKNFFTFERDEARIEGECRERERESV